MLINRIDSYKGGVHRMKDLDVEYLCTTIGRLSRVPVRIYMGAEKKFFYSVVPFPIDPILPWEDRILANTGKVSFLVTDDFDFYGIVHNADTDIVIGPSRQIPRTEAELHRLAFDLDIPKKDIEQFITAAGAILPLSLDFLLEIMCMIHHMFSGERLQLADLRVTDLEQRRLTQQATEEHTKNNFDSVEENKTADIYQSFQIEQELLDLVRNGSTQRLDKWVANVPAIHPGQIASDTLRQAKNIHIVISALVSRAAIQGGMDVEDAIRLSDSYIKKCEQLSTLDAIVNLQLNMVRNYTEHVARIRDCGARSELAQKVTSYIQHHLSEPIRTEDIAQALFLSRSHLSTRFKKEQGMDLTDYIQQVKIIEAKHLLRHTDRSLLTISNYLGFSSQSHFSRVFKSVVGVTPGYYRKRNK